MSGGQNYLLPAMDMAKEGGPLLFVKVCMCENSVSRFLCKFGIPSPLLTTYYFSILIILSVTHNIYIYIYDISANKWMCRAVPLGK